MIHLPRRKPKPVDERDHPNRIAAIRTFRDHLAAGTAGLDPYDPTIFILTARPNVKVWANRALELCGVVLTSVRQPGGSVRYRALLEADVRAALKLDRLDAPVVEDEPLASRAVDESRLADEGPAMRALRTAKAAYDRTLAVRAETDPDAHHPNCGQMGPCDCGAAEGYGPRDPLVISEVH